MRQLHPTTDSPVRLDPLGRAVFLVEGFRVNVQVRYLTDGEKQDAGGDVLLTATAHACDIALGEVRGYSFFNDNLMMRQVLDETISEAISSAQRKFDELSSLLTA